MVSLVQKIFMMVVYWNKLIFKLFLYDSMIICIFLVKQAIYI
jgi:hypothetical protein